MNNTTFGLGDSVEVQHASCLKWLRGVIIGGRNEFATFLVQFDHGERSWHSADRIRPCVQVPKVQR